MKPDDDLWNDHRRAFVDPDLLYPKDCFLAGLAIGRAEASHNLTDSAPSGDNFTGICGSNLGATRERRAGDHPSHHHWADFLAEARAAREDPPPNKLECFEGGFDTGRASVKAGNAVGLEALIEKVQSELFTREAFAALSELERRLGNG